MHPSEQGHRPLLLKMHPLTIYRHQVCKQADVLQAFVLAGNAIDCRPQAAQLRLLRRRDGA